MCVAKDAESYDERIDKDPEAVDLDEEFRENHMQLLGETGSLLESCLAHSLSVV